MRIGPNYVLDYEYKTKPYAHQEDMCLFGETQLLIKKEPGFAWFAEQGTGKTKATIDFANALYKANLIDTVFLVAPNGVHAQWVNEQLPLHSALHYYSLVFDTPLNRAEQFAFKLLQESNQDGSRPYWFCVNVEAFSRDTYIDQFREVLRNNRCLLVIDEATRIKNPDAERTKRIMFDINDVQRAQKRILKITRLSLYRIILTGTPITSSPFDVWAPVEFLRPGFWKMNYFAFKHRYGLMVRDTNRATGKPFVRKMTRDEMARIREMLNKGEGYFKIAQTFSISEMDVGYIAQHPETTQPYKNMDELRERLRQVGLFVRKEDALDLPKKVYITRTFQLTKEQRDLQRDLVRDFIAEYKDRIITVVNAISLTVRLHQISGGLFPVVNQEEPTIYLEHTPAKLSALVDDMEEYEFPLIVTCRFRAEARLLHERIAEKYADARVRLLMAEDKDRDIAIADFKAGKIDVLVATEGIIAIGYNLQVACTMLLYSTGLNFETRAQLEDRMHRAGQALSCTYVDYQNEDSFDVTALENQRHKKELLDYIRAGDALGFVKNIGLSA